MLGRKHTGNFPVKKQKPFRKKVKKDGCKEKINKEEEGGYQEEGL